MCEFQVYWYHLAEHTDPYSQGYIGVTMQNGIRQRCHIAGRSGGSKILSRAFKKYGAEAILQDFLHTVEIKEEAYALERLYRPTPRIGWNIATGGGLPPDGTGRKDSLEVRIKRSISVRKAKADKEYPSIFKGMTNRHSEERRRAIGDFHRGKTMSEAHKQAITEKNSGANNPHAKEVFYVHKDTPEKVYQFLCIKDAATSLGLPYNTLRSQTQRTLKYDRTSEPSRSGWICLTKQDALNPVDAVNRTIEQRSARFNKMVTERENNRKIKVLG